MSFLLQDSIELESKWGNQIQSIFFQSSEKKDFNNELERDSFFQRWTQYYLGNQWPGYTLLSLDSQENIKAYLFLANNSTAAIQHYELAIPSYLTFLDQFETFPAHLHMNTSPQHRSTGQGTLLINYAKEILQKKNINGVHLITSPDARNRNFYLKNGFHFEVQGLYKDYKLLFMGQTF